MKNNKKVAIVTGASSGIGLAAAKLLSTHGYDVYGFSRRKTSNDSATRSISVDVTKPASIEQGVSEVLRDAGRIDLLVNNAGVYLLGAAEESSAEQVRSVFETNVFGLMQVTRAVLPTMRKQGSGRIINISSVVGFLPGIYSSIYSASKHAVEGYTEALDHEIRTLGIRALLVEPAFTRTELGTSVPDSPLAAYAAERERMVSFAKHRIETGDTAESVAATILRAAEDSCPKLRYPSGTTAKRLAVMRRLVPARAFDRALRKNFKMAVA